MKTNYIIPTLTALFGFCLLTPLNAQTDSVKHEHETLKVEHDVTRTTGAAKPTPEPTVKAPLENTEPERPLRRLELGARFMPTLTSLAFNTQKGDVVQGEATLSLGYGAMFGVNLSKHIGLQLECNYNTISQTYKDQNLERQVHINYIDVPLLLSLSTDKSKCVNFNVVVGPQFGINAGSSITSNGTSASSDTVHALLAVKQGDVGVAYGAGLDFCLNKARTIRLDIGFRGVYGLVNIDSENIAPDTYNVLVKASRKSYAGYAGLTFLFL